MSSKSFKKFIEVKNSIDELSNKKIFRHFVNYISKKFDIPYDTANRYLKFKLSNSFDFKYFKFNSEFSIYFIFYTLLKYMYFIFYIFANSKSNNYKNNKKYDLLIDDIQNTHEIPRWYSIKKEFGNDKTVFISKYSKIISKDSNIGFFPTFKMIDRKILLKYLPKLLTTDILFLLRNSFKIKKNFFYLYIHFIKDYFYYSSLFNIYSAKYCLQDRNLGRLNPLKNYLFKKYNGILCGSIQKNIFQHNGTGMYSDIDVFFTLGDKTADDILKAGSKINKLVPTGSREMHIYLNDKKNISSSNKIFYDIIFIGLNTGSKLTNWKYNHNSIEWLSQLSLDFPDLTIGIKHHQNWKKNLKDIKILKNSKVELVNPLLNSYEIGFNAKVILTYGSTMAYEFIGNGIKNVFFLDPGNENPFINNFVYNDNIVFKKYDELKRNIFEIFNDTKVFRIKETKNYCYKNSNISFGYRKYLEKYS